MSHEHKFKRYDLPDGGYTEQCVVCGEYLTTVVDILEGELAEYKRHADYAYKLKESRIAALEAALRDISLDYPCIGVRNVHTGACVGCPVCDARDALTPLETEAK